MTTFITEKKTYQMLSKVNPFLKLLVIRKYLHAFSMNEIVKETPLSKGTVNSIVQDWKSQLAGIDVEEIRGFMYELRKSGITIEECAQGFRILQLLKKFDIYDEFEFRVNEDDLDFDLDELNFMPDRNPYDQHNAETTNRRQGNHGNIKGNMGNNQIIYFLEHIYKNCKNLGIKPNIIMQWIEDLLLSFHDLNTESDEDSVSNDTNGLDIPEAVEKNKNEQNPRREIPFVSSVSSYIKQKKKKIQRLENIKNSITNEIDDITKQSQEKTSKLNKTIGLEKKVYSYFSWYENLKQEVFKKHNLLIEQEFGTFVNAIDDFKQYNFDVTSILTEYKHMESLGVEKMLTKHQVDENTAKRDQLLNEVNSLEERVSYNKQAIDTFNELEKNGLGLKELKQLSYTIMESAFANDMEVKKSVKKFFIDLDKNYDNILGFEKKVKELKSQMGDIENQIPGYKEYMLIHLGAVSSLNNLNANGVTNIDIINMNQLVSLFRNSDFLSDPLDQNANKYTENNFSHNKMNNTMYWKQFISKLQRLKNINQEINKQISSQNILKNQFNILNNNKQVLEKAYTDAVTNLNIILSKIHYSLDIAGQINENIDKNKIIPLPIVFPVFIRSDSSGSNNKLDEKNQKDKKTDK